jgi:hypothetical protein
MPTQTAQGTSRAYTGPGLGSTPAVKTSLANPPQRALEEWRERITDQHVCWLVVRLIHCKFHWLTPEGGWDKRQKMAGAWGEREDAYQAARATSGLLYCYDRG